MVVFLGGHFIRGLFVYVVSCATAGIAKFPGYVFAGEFFGRPAWSLLPFAHSAAWGHACLAFFVFAELVPDDASVDATGGFREWSDLLVLFFAWLRKKFDHVVFRLKAIKKPAKRTLFDD